MVMPSSINRIRARPRSPNFASRLEWALTSKNLEVPSARQLPSPSISSHLQTMPSPADLAKSWLASLSGATFPLFIHAPLQPMPAAAGAVSSSYHTADHSLVLGFEAPLNAQDTKETVQAKLKYLAPQLGTPGLEISGWKTKSMPPVSSFKDGVEITSFTVSNGRAVLEVSAKVKFFAVMGTREGHRTPADAGMMPEDYIQERSEFYADLKAVFEVAV